jgi:hypothetical protein
LIQLKGSGVRVLLLLFFKLVVFACAAGAESKAPNEVLSAKEIQAEFPGTRMTGSSLTGDPFTECIEPDGRSIFNFEGRVSEGRMTVKESGQACFTYESGTWCYRIQRAPSGYLIRGINSNGMFRVRSVERDIESCTDSDLIG